MSDLRARHRQSGKIFNVEYVRDYYGNGKAGYFVRDKRHSITTDEENFQKNYEIIDE